MKQIEKWIKKAVEKGYRRQDIIEYLQRQKYDNKDIEKVIAVYDDMMCKKKHRILKMMASGFIVLLLALVVVYFTDTPLGINLKNYVNKEVAGFTMAATVDHAIDPDGDITIQTLGCVESCSYTCIDDGVRFNETVGFDGEPCGGDANGKYNIHSMENVTITNNVTEITVWIYIVYPDTHMDVDISISPDLGNTWESDIRIGAYGNDYSAWYNATFSGLQYDQDMINDLRVRTKLYNDGNGYEIRWDEFYVNLTESSGGGATSNYERYNWAVWNGTGDPYSDETDAIRLGFNDSLGGFVWIRAANQTWLKCYIGTGGVWTCIE